MATDHGANQASSTDLSSEDRELVDHADRELTNAETALTKALNRYVSARHDDDRLRDLVKLPHQPLKDFTALPEFLSLHAENVAQAVQPTTESPTAAQPPDTGKHVAVPGSTTKPATSTASSPDAKQPLVEKIRGMIRQYFPNAKFD